jgi:AraC-like DNA-binding protein
MLQAILTYTRKIEVTEFHRQSHESLNRRLEAAESRKSFAKKLGLSESTLSKKLKTDTGQTSIG